jgi:hypothetical protein
MYERVKKDVLISILLFYCIRLYIRIYSNIWQKIKIRIRIFGKKKFHHEYEYEYEYDIRIYSVFEYQTNTSIYLCMFPSCEYSNKI